MKKNQRERTLMQYMYRIKSIDQFSEKVALMKSFKKFIFVGVETSIPDAVAVRTRFRQAHP